MRRQDSHALSQDRVSVTLTSSSYKLQGMTAEVGLDLPKFFESKYFLILFIKKNLMLKNFRNKTNSYKQASAL